MSTATTPLRLAVVGHTNTGKTSLLRTLTRNPAFGEVQDSPGTTRHVQGARLITDEPATVTWYDTPGLEDASALLDYLDGLLRPGERPDGPSRLQRFLEAPEATRRFEQEARVLRQMLASDAALYVVDVRDPVLAKHRDELQLLAYAGRPLLPVLNFTHHPGQRLEAWRDALARLGLHVLIEFDTVAPPLDGEDQLYERLALLLDPQAERLRRFKQALARQRRQRELDARRLIAELLIDAAAWRTSCAPERTAIETATQTLREQLRRREQQCVDALLRCYHFDADTFPAHTLPLDGERWGMDLFHPQAIKDLGIHVGKGMAAGAMTGATLDAFMAGVSLGTATLAGAAIGGLWQGANKLGHRLLGRARGWHELSVDDPVLRLLAVRQLNLARALSQRGHAARDPLELADAADEADQGAQCDARWRKDRLPDPLQEARARPEWSTLSPEHAPNARRERAVEALMDVLEISRPSDLAR